MSHSITDVLAVAEEEKKYLSAAEAHYAFVVTADGALEHDAVLFLRCLAEKVSSH